MPDPERGNHPLIRTRQRDVSIVSLILAVLLVVLACASAQARTVLELDTARQPVALLDWGDYWIDTSGAATALAVGSETESPARWQALVPGQIHPIRERQALWIRFSIPPAPDAERWYLDVSYPAVNRVTLYTLDSAGQWIAQSAGDTIAVASWPVPHRHPLLPVQLSAEVPTKYLVRIENPNGFSTPLCFVSESYLSRTEQRVSLILGIYFGLAGLAAVLSLLSAIWLRDRAYGLYAGCVTLMALTQGSLTGIAGLHLWPESPWWNDHSALVLGLAATALTLLFTAEAVSLYERSRRLWRTVLAVVVADVCVIGLLMAMNGHARTTLMAAAISVSVLVGMGMVLWSWRRGDRIAPWIVLASAPVAIGSAFPIARTLGLMSTSLLTEHGMQVALAIELPVILVVLMMRSQQHRENRRRIEGFDRIDPATGLVTEEVFQERARLMFVRSQRLNHQSAVLMAEIVNIEQIRRDFGRRLAEELPLRTAARLLSTARDIDSVARLSETRFGLLIEGPLSPTDVAALGPRIVARCLMPFNDRPSDWTAQVHVVCALVPLDGIDLPAMTARMDAILGSVPRDSRKAVFNMGDLPAQAAAQSA